MDETTQNDSKPWLFKEGNPGGPGRPPETQEQKIIKKATKEIIKEYKENLANALPKIEPVLIKKAVEGDMTAIKEVHDRVMDKARQNTDITSGGESLQTLLVKILNDKSDNNGNPGGV